MWSEMQDEIWCENWIDVWCKCEGYMGRKYGGAFEGACMVILGVGMKIINIVGGCKIYQKFVITNINNSGGDSIRSEY